MKILLSNKYYYLRGGDCIYTIELERLLKDNGHEVAIFAMTHPSNLSSLHSKYFPREIDFNKKSIRNFLTLLTRPFGSLEVRRSFNRLIKEFKPDVLHINNIHSHLSPILAKIAYKHRIPVVWTLHDFKLLCPRYDCIRNGKPCELCFSSKYNVVRYKCIKNSLADSLLGNSEALFWNKERISRFTNIFICPSAFMYSKMIKGGFKSAQLTTLPNFINDSKLIGIPSNAEKNYYTYLGRLSAEKGIETLLKAAAGMPQYVLKVIGTGPLEKILKEKYTNVNIEFLGFRKWEELKIILEGSKFMVIPSECYENNPLSIIESLCLGTPVIGANIGGIPELIEPSINGLLFESGNVNDLQNQIINLWQNSSDFSKMTIAKNANAKYNSGNYYYKLIKIYDNVVDSSK
jgi:glycosyltransferase involved in cell wall biosynthesis